LLPKKPVSLMQSPPALPERRPGAGMDDDDDDELEYAENPFEEDQRRK